MKNLFTLLILVFLSNGLMAQSIIKVHVEENSFKTTLPGATVVVRGTTNGTSTDMDGNATISALSTDSIIVSLMGYNSQTVAVSNNSSLTILLASSDIQLGEMVVVGTRSAGRSRTETTAPVDVISVSSLMTNSGRADITSMLNYAAPSLNANKQSGADGADHIDLATLRGLGPDQTLVLVNGKRRHQTAFVAVYGTRGRGNSGTDLSAIPISAIDRIEILRDGASAQYGSDAIAGVINIVTKKTTGYFTGDVGYGTYADKEFNPANKSQLMQYESGNKLDGNAFSLNANYGIKLGKKGGYLNFSLSALNQQKTFRQVLDTANLFTNANALPINKYRRANGDASIKSIGTFFNGEMPLTNNKTTLYTFGGFSFKKSEAFAYSRNFSARPNRFPTDTNDSLLFVDGIMHTTPDGEVYYNPIIQTAISDLSWAFGARGETKNNWLWDLSNTIGRNDFHFYGDQTFNASLGTAQTNFNNGGFSFLQNTTNFDMSRKFNKIMQGLQFSFGAEHRLENYTLYAGEEASYRNYDTSGVKASGSQGFPGYQPKDEVNASRNTIGLYADAELDITKKWLLTAAVRAENYSDFGFTSNYKASTRYKLRNNLNIRSSVSTGFRAPSLQQINFSSTFTNVQGGLVSEVKIAPNYSALTKAAGIEELKQEVSTNFNIGMTWSPVREFNVSVDFYQVKVKDRVVLSGQFDGADNTLDSTFLTALQDNKVDYAQFFANAVNTTNSGVDVVLEYKKVTLKNSLRLQLSGNIQKMSIDKINVPAKLNDTEQHQQTFLSDREQSFILASAPSSKFSFNAEYGFKKFVFGMRLTYFGEVTLLGFGEDALGIKPQVPTDTDPSVYVADKYVYGGKVVADINGTYKMSDKISFIIGVDNLFNVHPDLGAVATAKNYAFNNESAGPWDAVQMGGNGRRLYARLAVAF